MNYLIRNMNHYYLIRSREDKGSSCVAVLTSKEQEQRERKRFYLEAGCTHSVHEQLVAYAVKAQKILAGIYPHTPFVSYSLSSSK